MTSECLRRRSQWPFADVLNLFIALTHTRTRKTTLVVSWNHFFRWTSSPKFTSTKNRETF